MKKNLLSLFASISLILFISTGCDDKNATDDPPPKTKTQLITTGNWKYNSATWGGANMDPFLQACYKDNFAVFTSTGTGMGNGTLDEGLTKCAPGDPQTTPFSWTFQSGETQLVTSAPLLPGGSTTFTIVSLLETQLVVSQPYTISGTTKDAVVTFIH
jgi:hypothetical protein